MAHRHRTFMLLVGTLGLAMASPASATTINLTASLDCAQANAGLGTCGAGGTGTGSATITLDDVTHLLSWNVSWSGLSGAVIFAHFHGPALPSQNAGVQVGISIVSPAIGNAVINAGQETDLLAGLWYLNIHSTPFPSGEIRGQVSVVPEPATLALAGAGIALLALRRRR